MRSTLPLLVLLPLVSLDQAGTTAARGSQASTGTALERAETAWKQHRYKEASEELRAAVAAHPNDPAIRVRWGRLFLERFNPAEAEKLFDEALQLKPDYPPALLGNALVAAEGYHPEAAELAAKAIALDPSLTEARLLLARLALEDGDLERARTEARKANLDGPVAIADWMQDRNPETVPADASSYALAGRIFVLNRRYEEGIGYYRRALDIDPTLDSARSQLGVNLMRLGREKEAREHLERAYERGYRDAATVNTLRLMDSYKNFVERKTDKTIVRVHRKEADLIGPYVEAELKRVMAVFDTKYKFKLAHPVQVEVYPDHEDFAVRTLGMPGLGALGVTFGYVVAMDSPSGRPPGTFHWASTLWHEMSHVYVLSATQHRVPRWFTEGMAVYEETQVSPDWGDRLEPPSLEAMQKKQLLPVAELDRGFVRPSYPAQVGVSYFQAGMICTYIAEQWNYSKLLDMVQSFADRKSTPEVIEQNLGMKPAEFDKKFLAWLDTRVGKTVSNYADWKTRMRELTAAARAGRNEVVIAKGPAVRDLYPDYVEPGCAYELIANARLAADDKQGAMEELERYSNSGGRSPELIQKLASLQEGAGAPRKALASLQRLIYIYPMQEDLHRRLGELLLAEKRAPEAAAEFEAALAARPIDSASSRFNLARALRAQNKIDDAREQLILALEAAPGYKPAQKMLLELSQ